MEWGHLIHDSRCYEALVLKFVTVPGTGQAFGWEPLDRAGPGEPGRLLRDP